jgi:HlyD family secretion protein
MGERVRHRGWIILGLLLAGGGLALALDPPTSSPAPKASSTSSAAPAKPATFKVKAGPFRTQVTLQGVFEAESAHEIAFHPHTTAMGVLPPAFVVQHAIAHGAAVKKGDMLVQLDTRKVDQALADRRAEHALALVALKRAEQDLPRLEASLPLDLAAAERDKKHADEDYKRFITVDRPLSEESAKQSVKDASYRLQAAQEELKQLQSMYRDKDLTEETEEYILKRQRQEVQDALFYLKSATIRRDETLKVTLPRREISLKNATLQDALALDKIKNGSALTLSQTRLSLQKMKVDFRRGGDVLRHLEEDQAAMTVRAPIDGIVYYGQYSSGQWSPVSMMAAKLRPHGMILPDEVFMTIVSARPLFVRATVDEKDLHALKAEQTARIVPTGFPGLSLTGRVLTVSAVPQSAGKFVARLSVELGPNAGPIMPGMACEAKIVTSRNAKALTVPSSAVFSDEDDEHYVYLAHGHKKQPVKVGETNGKKTEILDGLKAGDQILLSKPG